MRSVSTYWWYVKTRVLQRKVPHAVLSWRYFSPEQSGYVRTHRTVFLNAWKRLPRLGWVIIALYSYLVWFFYQGWRQAWLAWRKNSSAYARQQQVSQSQQLRDLTYLTFLQTTPPSFYYRYGLSRYPREEWLKFIYTHELPHWHLAFSPNLSPESERLMSDKQLFAEVMGQQGLPVVSGALFESGDQLHHNSVFQGRNLFLKPRRGSQKQSCMALRYDASLQSYQLDTVIGILTQPSEILDYLRAATDRTPYLVQPMLENHPHLLEVVSCSHLMTFRVVTFWKRGAPAVVSTLLEWQQETVSQVQRQAIYPIAFDVVTGNLSDHLVQVFDLRKQERARPALLKNYLPIGSEIERIAKNAHQLLPDIFAVGWDVVWTPSGLQLLEGNINWGVEAHQMQGPTLIEHYIS